VLLSCFGHCTEIENMNIVRNVKTSTVLAVEDE